MASKLNIKQRIADFKTMDKADKRRWWSEFFIENALYIIIVLAIIGIYIYNNNFLSIASIVNIITLSAANLPIALGIAGAIILTGTDLSAGRVVGLTACIAASLLQAADYSSKMFAGIGTLLIELLLNRAFALRDRLIWSYYPLTVLVLIGVVLFYIDCNKPLKERLARKFFI